MRSKGEETTMKSEQAIQLMHTAYGTVVQSGKVTTLFKTTIFPQGVGGAIVESPDDVHDDGFEHEIPDALMSDDREAMERWLEQRRDEDLGYGSLVPASKLMDTLQELSAIVNTCDVRLVEETRSIAIGYGPLGPRGTRSVSVDVDDMYSAVYRLMRTYGETAMYVTVLPRHVVLVPEVDGTPCITFVEAAS
jgi:hypothetical protein